MGEVRGFVDRITYSKNGFHIFQMFLPRESRRVTCKGNLWGIGGIEYGLPLAVTGSVSEHPKFGPQLSVTSWSPWVADSEAVSNWLSFLYRDLLEPAQIKDIVSKHGKGFLKALREDPDLKVEGLDPEVFNRVKDSWILLVETIKLASFLAKYGVQTFLIQAVLNTGRMTRETIEADPYSLMDVEDFPFALCDDIAQDLGIPETDIRRFQGAVLWALREAKKSGHLCRTTDQLFDELKALARSSSVSFDGVKLLSGYKQALTKLIADVRVVQVKTGEIYSPMGFLFERGSAAKLSKLISDLPDVKPEAIQDFLVKYQSDHAIEFSEDQVKSITITASNRVSVVTGLPGTGKTTVVKAAVRWLESQKIPYLLMAPTGIAAKRLSTVTGRPASTIHRTLGYNGFDWEHSESNKLMVKAVIIDEMSMVDQELCYRLLSSLEDDSYVVFVGDDAQLPSVGPGNVLRELLASGAVPSIRLTKIFRQAETSEIITNAHRVHRGEVITQGSVTSDFTFVPMAEDSTAVDLVVKMCTKLKERGSNFQVLSPKYEGTLGVDSLNSSLQQALNPPTSRKKEERLGDTLYREGDRVMVVRNDYHNFVFNGDQGEIVGFDRDDVIISVYGADTDGGDLTIRLSKSDAAFRIKLSYAVTVHKCQGQEYDTVILPVYNSGGRMLQRNLLYTAITRAKKKVWAIGETTAVTRAIDNNRVVARGTLLAFAIDAEHNKRKHGTTGN